MVLLAVPAFLASTIGVIIAQTPAHQRLMVGFLLLATTMLTCSSVAAYGFMVLYTGKTLFLQMSMRARGIALFLAIISLAICVASGAMLGFLLMRV